MKILFLNPPSLKTGSAFTREGKCTQDSGVWTTTYPPYSLAQCASIVHEIKGVEVQGFDGSIKSYTLNKLIEIVNKETFDWIFVATGSPSFDQDLEVVKILKEVSFHSKIVTIGTHAASLGIELLLKTNTLEGIIKGEPELKVEKLCRGVPYSQIPGLIYCSDGKGYENPEQGWIENLEDLPTPRWEIFPLSEYKLPLLAEPYLILVSERGCPWNCSFCTAPLYYGHNYRKRGVEALVREIRDIKNKFGIQNFLFWNDTFTADREYVLNICNSIAPLDIRWVCNSRVDTFDLELAEQMKRAGCWMIAFGIESSSQSILNRSSKGIKVQESESAVRMAQKAGLYTVGHFIAGLPGETWTTLIRSVYFAVKLKLNVFQFYAASPFPGTRLFEEYAGSSKDFPSLLSTYSQSKPSLGGKTLGGFRLKLFHLFIPFLNVLRWPFISMGLKLMAKRLKLRNSCNSYRREKSNLGKR